MNSSLQGRVYDIPQHIIQHLNHHLTSQQGADNEGVDRARNLLNSGKVNYGQLKRILHDMKYIDKQNDVNRYNLYGGDVMEKWGNSILTGDRNLVQNNKDSRNTADNIGAINGMRQNSHLSTHKKKDSYTTPANMMKSNSEKSSVSSISSFKLFEQVEKIKEMMKIIK